jgi:hypothetical protein
LPGTSSPRRGICCDVHTSMGTRCDIPHHTVSVCPGRRLSARDRRSKTTGNSGSVCRPSFYAKSQLTLRSNSFTSAMIICGVAVTSGPTWQAGFRQSVMFTTSSKPTAPSCHRSAGPTAPMQRTWRCWGSKWNGVHLVVDKLYARWTQRRCEHREFKAWLQITARPL